MLVKLIEKEKKRREEEKKKNKLLSCKNTSENIMRENFSYN